MLELHGEPLHFRDIAERLAASGDIHSPYLRTLAVRRELAQDVTNVLYGQFIRTAPGFYGIRGRDGFPADRWSNVLNPLLGLDKAIESLPEKERHVIVGRFGLQTGEYSTAANIGRDLKVTSARVRQLEKSGLTRLKNAARTRDLQDGVRVLEELHARIGIAGADPRFAQVVERLHPQVSRPSQPRIELLMVIRTGCLRGSVVGFDDCVARIRAESSDCGFDELMDRMRKWLRDTGQSSRWPGLQLEERLRLV